MKIFEIRWTINEKSWVCASTNIEALKKYESITGMGLLDFDERDDIVELPESEWESHTIIEDEEGRRLSFAEYMKTAVEPDLLCETFESHNFEL